MFWIANLKTLRGIVFPLLLIGTCNVSQAQTDGRSSDKAPVLKSDLTAPYLNEPPTRFGVIRVAAIIK